MRTRFQALGITLAGLVLLLSACGNEQEPKPDGGAGSDQGRSNQQQPAPARATAANERVMGRVRWDDQDHTVQQVGCDLSHGACTVRGRGEGFQLRVELHGQEERSQVDLDPDQPLMVNLRIDQEEGPHLSFTMNSNHRLMGEVEGGQAGYAGLTHLVAANNAAGRLYPYPEGIEVEFELNCP